MKINLENKQDLGASTLRQITYMPYTTGHLRIFLPILVILVSIIRLRGFFTDTGEVFCDNIHISNQHKAFPLYNISLPDKALHTLNESNLSQ